ncbi:MAG: ABC transporter ATP-binding protein [Armatimonadetes bacterium]|nr:ABC transporter ATP-binding protein [Armatimonadota bacterium]
MKTEIASDVLLDVQNANVRFDVGGGQIRALDDVTIQLKRGEALAVVGESGCGKTTLARVVLGLQTTTSGAVTLDGQPVVSPKAGQAKRVGMVWQDPFASIEPLWKIRRILDEPFRLNGMTGDIEKIMNEVGLDPKLADRFPHELSGGQRQRAAIGRAIALRPPLIICDEPTAALDLSIQAQILNLLKDIQRDTGCSLLYISHDLLTVRYLCDRIAVMYMGQVVETGPTEDVFTNPRHPYTKSLLESAPSLETLGQLPNPVEGEIPDPKVVFTGCKFASRCPKATEHCKSHPAPWDERGSHPVLCHFPLDSAT